MSLLIDQLEFGILYYIKHEVVSTDNINLTYKAFTALTVKPTLTAAVLVASPTMQTWRWVTQVTVYFTVLT